MDGESYGRDFEYDEADEGDEAYEADGEADEGDESDEADETFEASDEADEADEADESDEADGEADEAFEASDESDESDEADEADEGADEARMSARARLRADRDRNRRAAYARRLASAQRRDAKRAATTQRSITSQIKAIQPGPPARVARVGTLQGAGVVTAILPNGRRSRMRITPTLAPVKELNRLKSVVQVNERRQAAVTRRNSRAISRLANTQANVVRKLTTQQLKSDRDLARRLVESHNRLDKRITKELSGGSGVFDRHGKRMGVVMKRHRSRQVWNNVLMASAFPFFAAYGDKGDPFGKNNLIMTGSLLAWMFGDEIIDNFAGESKVVKGGASLWSYLAPVGHGATTYFLLRNQQHERFITGVTPVGPLATPSITINLEDEIGSSAFEDFKGANHTVAVTITAAAAVVAAATTAIGSIDATTGNLVISFLPALPAASGVSVAWIVDTEELNQVPVAVA